MKNVTSIVLLIVSIALGAVAIYEYQQAEHYSALVALLRRDAAAAREESDGQASELRKLKDQTRNQKVAIQQLEERNKELVNASPTDAPKTAGAEAAKGEGGGSFMKGFAKMFSDPKMKEAMRAQQVTAVNMMYGDLARELGLAPDEARQVLALLTDRQADLTNRGMEAMSRDGGNNLKDAGKETQAVKAGYDEQLKATLGKEKFAKFQDYEKTVVERMTLDQVQKQMAAGGMPMEQAQTQALLTIMKEERARVPNSASPTDTAAQAKMMQSDAAVDSWLKTQEDFNRRVLDRARTVLSPDQMLTFEAAQKQQIQMQRMGIQMSREMFKSGSK
jgi:hypothetical protein